MENTIDESRRTLLTKMRDISISSFGRAWVHELEFALWVACRNECLCAYGFNVTLEESVSLKELSTVCAGWFISEGGAEQIWLPSDEWAALFERACPKIYRDLLLQPTAIENEAQIASRELFLKSPAALTILECRRLELNMIETVRITREEHQLGIAEFKKLYALVDDSDWNALLYRQNKFYSRLAHLCDLLVGKD